MKALFLAPTHQQARYWAQQLGFARNEWRYVASLHQAMGYGPGTTLYLVGTWSDWPGVYEFLDRFAAAGIDAILAEEMA